MVDNLLMTLDISLCVWQQKKILNSDRQGNQQNFAYNDYFQIINDNP